MGLKHALHGHFAPVHGPTPPHGTEYITYKGMTLRKPPDSQMYIGRWLGFCTWFFFMYMFYNKGRDRLYPGHKNLLDADLAHEPSIYDPKDADEEYYIEYAQKNGIQLPAKGEHEAEHGRH